MTNNYRSELDGLRAIAIIFIVLSHMEYFNFTFESGGVNIFFVLTGYLISQILIFRDKDLKTFFRIRFLKLYPLIFLTSLLTLILFFLIGDLNNWSVILRSFISSILGFTNLYLINIENLYGENNSNPFGPLWAFSIIIQFYLIFPFILKLIFFFKKQNNFSNDFIILSLIIISFILWTLSIFNQNSLLFDFYSPLSRFWQFFLGSSLFFFISYRKKLFFNRLSIYIGLILILFWQFKFSLFNDWRDQQLVITIAALLIIYSTKQTILSKFLSLKPFILLGKASFIIYLVHSPVIYFVEIWFEKYKFFTSLFLIFIFTIIFNKFIFSSFFNKNLKFIAKSRLISFFSIIFLISLIGTYHFQKNEVIKKELNLKEFVKNKNFLNFEKNLLVKRIEKYESSLESEPLKGIDGVICHNREINDSYLRNCLFKSGENKRNFFLVGGSQMASLSLGLKKKLDKNNYYHLTGSLHIFLPNFEKILTNRERKDKYFFDLNNLTENLFSKINQESIILIGARFPVHINESFFNNYESGAEKDNWYGVYKHIDNPFLDWKEVFKEKITNLAKNENIKIILLYPIPEVGFDVPKRIAQDYKFFPYKQLDTSFDIFKKRTRTSFELLNSIKGDSIYRVYPHTIFCNTFVRNRCVTQNKKEIFYSDDDHPSTSGVKLINELIMNKIKEIYKVN